jgi:hypothetical protein
MDTILNGIASSSYPLSLKRELVSRVSPNIIKESQEVIPSLLSVSVIDCYCYCYYYYYYYY